jgi:hypothetical protein
MVITRKNIYTVWGNGEPKNVISLLRLVALRFLKNCFKGNGRQFMLWFILGDVTKRNHITQNLKILHMHRYNYVYKYAYKYHILFINETYK